MSCYGNLIFFYVEKSLNQLSLLTLCKLTFPIDCLKVCSVPSSFELKSTPKIFVTTVLCIVTLLMREYLEQRHYTTGLLELHITSCHYQNLPS